MSDINESIETTESVIEHCKNAFGLLKQGKVLPAIREVFGILKAIYVNHLKGKYIEVKGKKIPLTGIVIAIFLVLYCLFSAPAPEPESGRAWIANNSYDRDGLRVYGIKKCDSSACGTIENTSDKNFDHIRIHLTFHNQTGEAVAEGTADAMSIAPNTNAKFEIPCEEDFAYAKMDDILINPKLEAEEKTRLREISVQNAAEETAQ